MISKGSWYYNPLLEIGVAHKKSFQIKFDEYKIYIKIIELDAIYNFLVDYPFIWPFSHPNLRFNFLDSKI